MELSAFTNDMTLTNKAYLRGCCLWLNVIMIHFGFILSLVGMALNRLHKASLLLMIQESNEQLLGT